MVHLSAETQPGCCFLWSGIVALSVSGIPILERIWLCSTEEQEVFLLSRRGPMDLIIRHARLRGREGTWDIGITGDHILTVAAHLSDEVTTEVDAAGNLVLPTYVNGHIHLDKCFLQERMRPNKDYTFSECLELTWEHKAQYTTQDIVERAGRAIQEGILNGTTVFRAFADVDSIGKLRALQGLLALREHWRDGAHIEVVAFPQEGIIRDPGTEALMEEAMRLGADVVGGLPWFELLDEDVRAHIDVCFALARRYDKDIHMLVDDTDNPLSRSALVPGRQDAAGGLPGSCLGQPLWRVGGLQRGACPQGDGPAPGSERQHQQ
jgi:cytosine/adenosine deaminase-related metal-dependent hydrolase